MNNIDSVCSSLREFRKKEIINITDGRKIGYVDDLSFTITQGSNVAEITHLIVNGRYKLLGILGKNDDLKIPLYTLQTIGEDTLLVRLDDQIEEFELLSLSKPTQGNRIIDFIKNIF